MYHLFAGREELTVALLLHTFARLFAELFVLLGASHEACRRHLAGAELDLRWLREDLPELAWRSALRRRGGRSADGRREQRPVKRRATGSKRAR